MDALRFGLEADQVGQAVEQVKHWLSSNIGEHDDYLAQKVGALLEEVTREHCAKRERAERFLARADGKARS